MWRNFRVTVLAGEGVVGAFNPTAMPRPGPLATALAKSPGANMSGICSIRAAVIPISVALYAGRNAGCGARSQFRSPSRLAAASARGGLLWPPAGVNLIALVNSRRNSCLKRRASMVAITLSAATVKLARRRSRPVSYAQLTNAPLTSKRQTPIWSYGGPSMSAIAWVISVPSRGRTSLATSRPSLRKTRVGHSFTPKDRPRGRPRPSSIFMCRNVGCPARPVARRGCAARQWPQPGLPNSSSAGPRI